MSVNEQARGSVASGRGERRRRKGAWWIPVLLLGLLIAGVIAFAATRGSDDNGGASTSAGQRSAGGSGRANQGSAGAGGDTSALGSLTAGGANVLAAGGASNLSRYSGQSVRGRGVKVVSVVGNEVFWVGKTASNRVLVHMNTRGESPFKVRAGDRVTFTGRMTPARAGAAATFGVTKAEGANLLARQKQFVETDISRVKLAK